MRRTAAFLLAELLMVPCVGRADSASPAVMRIDGLGPVKLGMKLKDAERVLGVKLKTFKDSGYDDEACWTTSRVDGRESFISYMIQAGRITRIDIFQPNGQPTPPIRIAEGLGVGSSERQLTETFGARLHQSPHPYLGLDGKYMEVLSSNRKSGLLFETADGTVTSYRAGLMPSLEYIEGCS